MLGPVCDDLVHEGQCFNRRPFHHVNYDASHHSVKLLPICQLISYSASYRASQRMPDDHHVFLGEALQQLLEGLDCLAAQGFNRVVVSNVFLLRKAMPLQVVGQ